MLTEIDINRIMEAKHRLTEQLSKPVDYVLVEDGEALEKLDNEPSIYELQGLV